VAEAEENATLFCAHNSLELDEEGSGDKHQASTFFTAGANLNLDEPRARVFLNTGTGDNKLDGWYLDIDATHHMMGRRELFTDLDISARGTVRFGDESKVEIHGIGSIIFEAKTGEDRVLHGVYYIPALRNLIMSLGQLDEGGLKVEIEDGVLRICDRRKRLLVKVRRSANRLYILHLNAAKQLCLAARKDHEAWRWHERFNHLHFDVLHQLARDDMVRGLPAIDHVSQFYDTCVITKHRSTPFPAEAQYRAQDPLELIHGDLCGPISLATPGGRRYFLLLVDDATRYMWVALLTTKDATTDVVKHLQAVAEKKSGRKLRVLRTDNGREFTVAEFMAYYAEKGIKRHYSAPYSPQQNGVVERRNQTVVAMARALLKRPPKCSTA
jgi:transposase InsO family protein